MLTKYLNNDLIFSVEKKFNRYQNLCLIKDFKHIFRIFYYKKCITLFFAKNIFLY